MEIFLFSLVYKFYPSSVYNVIRISALCHISTILWKRVPYYFAVGEGSGEVPEESGVSAEEAMEDLEEKAEAMLENSLIIGILFGVMAAVALISALVSAQKFSIKGR